MAAEQSTTMVLKVDLQCRKCYKEVKKVLCKFPQIRDQAYDEKQNTVTIKVVCCCSPEKLTQKIQCKGGESIKSIDIKSYNNPPGDKTNGTKSQFHLGCAAGNAAGGEEEGSFTVVIMEG